MTRRGFDLSTHTGRAAQARYRRRQIGYGRWQPFTDPTPVREHIAALKRFGLSEVAIARLAGEPDTRSLSDITRPNSANYVTKLTTERARRLLAVTFNLDAIEPHRLIDSAGTRRRIEALSWMGWSASWVGEQLGISKQAVTKYATRDKVSVASARAVRDVYDRTWNKQGDNQRTRTYARQHGWHGPLAWDDNTIDDPDATPDVGEITLDMRRSEWTIEDVEWLLKETAYTWEGMSARLGVKRKALERRLYREDRYDLTRKLTVNTGWAEATA